MFSWIGFNLSVSFHLGSAVSLSWPFLLQQSVKTKCFRLSCDCVVLHVGCLSVILILGNIFFNPIIIIIIIIGVIAFLLGLQPILLAILAPASSSVLCNCKSLIYTFHIYKSVPSVSSGERKQHVNLSLSWERCLCCPLFMLDEIAPWATLASPGFKCIF